MGWAGFGRQGAEKGEMPLGYRATSAVINNPWVHPLPPLLAVATAHFAWAVHRVWNWHKIGFAHREETPGQYIISGNTEKKSERI